MLHGCLKSSSTETGPSTFLNLCSWQEVQKHFWMPAMFLYDSVVIFQADPDNLLLGNRGKMDLGIHLLCFVFNASLTKWKRFLTTLFTFLGSTFNSLKSLHKCRCLPLTYSWAPGNDDWSSPFCTASKRCRRSSKTSLLSPLSLSFTDWTWSITYPIY